MEEPQAVKRAFGRAARRLREQRDLTREDVGARGGLSAVYIGNIERGKINPTLLTQVKLANGIGLPLNEIIATALRSEPSQHGAETDAERGGAPPNGPAPSS